MRSFFDKTIHKSNLEISIEWNQPLSRILINSIILIHVDSFLNAYRNISEQELGLSLNVTKTDWLTKMITDEIEEMKSGEISYACAFIQDELAGFITCDQEKPRYKAKTVMENKVLKNDVFIRLLSIKPINIFFIIMILNNLFIIFLSTFKINLIPGNYQ